MVRALHDLSDSEPLLSPRLELEPLRPEHADEMAPLLDDGELHTFIGGGPATREELLARYRRQAIGWSPDRAERWFNWVVRRRDLHHAVGFVQATVTVKEDRLTATVAWVIGSAYQRRGYATESAHRILAWLKGQEVEVVAACIHPEHHASIAVARAIGLKPTGILIDGETLWTNWTPLRAAAAGLADFVASGPGEVLTS